jgi:hypothetical protein
MAWMTALASLRIRRGVPPIFVMLGLVPRLCGCDRQVSLSQPSWSKRSLPLRRQGADHPRVCNLQAELFGTLFSISRKRSGPKTWMLGASPRLSGSESSPAAGAAATSGIPWSSADSGHGTEDGPTGLRSASLALSTVMVGAGRPSTSLLAKGWVFLMLSDWPQGLWLQSKKNGSRRTRRDSRDHGGERPLSPHSRFSVHLLGQLRVLRVKILAVAPTRLTWIRSGGDRQPRRISDQGQANSWMVGLRRP